MATTPTPHAHVVTAADLTRLEHKIDVLADQTALLVERQQFLSHLYEDMMPIARLMLGTATETLGDLERRGYVAYGRELLHLIDNIVSAYPPEAVHELADNVVQILDVVRRLTQPDVLAMAEGAAEAVQGGERAKPLGVVGMLRATTGDDDVRRGLAIALGALREIGRAAGKEARDGEGHRRLNPLIGAKRNLGGGHHAPGARPATTARAASATRGATQSTSAATPPSRPAAPSVSIPGVVFTADGFLEDPHTWTEDIAQQIAAHLGISPLGDRHWVVIRFAREDFLTTGASPNIRRLTTGSGVSTKELYHLFPKAPAKATAMIAGIPKPVGCI
jgi:TusE/DsrC/DsvC family sulfur relay protein